MAKGFKVIKTDGETGNKSQCGGVVKTGAKAQDLRQRMRGQQERGSSNSFTVERA